MSSPPDVAVARAEPAQDPWDRYGWVMGAIWLVFLGFPLAAAFTSDQPVALRALAVALVVVFAAVYLHGFVRVGALSEEPRRAWAHVGVTTALMVGTAALLGVEALGMAPFVVSLAVFLLPLREGLAVWAVLLVAVVVVVIESGQDGAWFLVGIVVLVGTVGVVVRQLETWGLRHRETVADLALVAERERVARDVHDVLGHSLTVLTVKAELAERLVDADPERAKAELAQIRDLTRQSLAEIRATVGGLRVARLADELEASRTALTDAGIDARLPDDPTVVDPRHRIVLAWSLREAVTNVVRHSGASRCCIEVGSDWLVVSDDGHGRHGRPEGNGLRGLRERAATAGGTVDIGDPETGTGTTLRVQL
ncbi:sensor histidine kinase [Nocardioides sp. GXQ0305]|uniref:sensor histidine kinase n=1 Tax=Nocardioides sp. GXQ0305 TaxID=3423912 RepID=UPI003D7D39D1